MQSSAKASTVIHFIRNEGPKCLNFKHFVVFLNNPYCVQIKDYIKIHGS